MKLTDISRQRLRAACETLCRTKKHVGKNVSTGVPSGDTVGSTLKSIAKDMPKMAWRGDNSKGPIFVDCNWYGRGVGQHFSPVMELIDPKGNISLVSVWVDDVGTAQINVCNGQYTCSIKVVVPNELEEWIIDFLRVTL